MAAYKCEACGFQWEQMQPSAVTCFDCGHIYVKWVNYEEDFANK